MLNKIAVLGGENNLTVIKELSEEEATCARKMIEYMEMYEFIYYSTEPMVHNMISFSNLLDELNHGIRNIALSKYQIVVSIQNLLSSMRGYIDTFAHTLSEFYGKESDIYNSFKAEKSLAFDNNKSYRFIESLRNHVQHRGYPIDKMNIKLIDNNKVIQLILLKESLISNDKLSKKNRDFIDNNFESEIDITTHIKTMFGLLLLIHDKILFSVYSDDKFEEFFKYYNYKTKVNESLLLVDIESLDYRVNLDLKMFNFEGMKLIKNNLNDTFEKFHKKI